MSKEIREQIEKSKKMMKISANESSSNGAVPFDPQRNFDKAIYLYYVGLNADSYNKHVSKEEFEKLFNDKVAKKETINSDKSNKYRLSDSREMWLDKYGRQLGVVWKQDNDSNVDFYNYNGNLESYWIHKWD
jgi:hypothetical protein